MVNVIKNGRYKVYLAYLGARMIREGTGVVDEGSKFPICLPFSCTTLPNTV